MKNITSSLIIFLVSGCCKQPEAYKYCSYENPLTELSVLKETIETAKEDDVKIEIKHYKYENLEYFRIEYIKNKNGVIYDCTGNEMCSFDIDNSNCDDALSNLGQFIEWSLLN